MNNELQMLTTGIEEHDISSFMSKTVSTVTAKKNTEKVTVDFSW